MINNSLPDINYRILKSLLDFLSLVMDRSCLNKMTSSNLAIVFGPNLVWSRDQNIPDPYVVAILICVREVGRGEEGLDIWKAHSLLLVERSHKIVVKLDNFLWCEFESKLDSVWIDNNVFRLHYKATVMVFVAASLMVTSRQFFGDPIDCIVDNVPGDIMDTYCWIHSTFTIPNKISGEVGKDMPFPGISPIADLEPGTEVKFHKYYQWVCFFLFFEAALFYVPRHLWKSSEGGKISMLVGELMEPLLEEEKRSDQISLIVKYFTTHRGTHTLYALRDDPMALVFPKVTKCTFNKYGPSGTIEVKDGLCVLPLNIINEKIFIFLWFWLIVIAAISGLFLIYRLFVLLGFQIRVALITYRGGRSTKRDHVASILNAPSFSYMEKIGDWLVLYLLCKNLDVLTVNELIKHLRKSTEMSDEKSENYEA
ncbi:inx [Lepeophtheirus salmonis]|uniref:Innexin n=1 Tax=Lepeophtheirus salmonis TaxID=72036 RepID=A0A7R8H7B4_LEPSM|nr:inx [Lepeophtheirus salmonis]CAF2898756.1 inx [Lepeophtheirus salmonis]